MAKTERTTAGLREALFEQIDRLREDDCVKEDVDRARAVSDVAKQIINVARAEMEFHDKMNKDEKLCDDFMTGEIRLGGSKPRLVASANGSATEP